MNKDFLRKLREEGKLELSDPIKLLKSMEMLYSMGYAFNGSEWVKGIEPRTKVSCEGEWNGEGLPPKGARVILDNYEKMSVLYGHEDFGTVVEVVAEIPEERCCVVRLKYMLGIFDESFFRPIETSEQEEERIRKEAVSEMVGHAWKDQSTEECRRFAESLYDVGYRKPE